jgi:hypothetical protein
MHGYKYLQITDDRSRVIALVPYSDRTDKMHLESHADASLIADAQKMAARITELEDLILVNVDPMALRKEHAKVYDTIQKNPPSKEDHVQEA